MPAYQGLAQFYSHHAEAVEKEEGKEAADKDRANAYGKLSQAFK